MDSIDVLREAISAVPVPSAPPRLSMDGAAAGLGFLDATLRLNHVRRLTERLTIHQHRIAHKSTEVEISLNMLTDSQLQATQMLQKLASHSSVEPHADFPDSPVWVPIARLSQTNVSPIEVRDSSGRRLPSLTQYETSRLMASGLYRLLRGILMSHPDAGDAETDLGKLLFRIHEPRWIIQSAILAVLTDMSKPQQTKVDVDLKVLSDPYREMALTIFNERYGPLLQDYFQLFDVAINDYVVVVALDGRFDEHLVTYRIPLCVVNDSRDGWSSRFLRLARASLQGYYVNYQNNLPTALRSYHLVAEASQGVDVSRIMLTTNAHEREVHALIEGLRVVAGRLEELKERGGQSVGKVLELMLRAQLIQLSELVRKSQWGTSAVGLSAPNEYIPICTTLVRALESYETKLRQGEGGKSLIEEPIISAKNLRQAADEVDAHEFGYDIVIGEQPISNRSDVYWRSSPLPRGNTGRAQISASILLRNSTESSASMVGAYSLMVTLVTYGVACFATKSFWPFGPSTDKAFAAVRNPEAVIAVLLLVPGFLYTRLSLPELRSVASYLRAVPRMAAYVCIASMAGLAADVAAGPSGLITRLAFSVGSAVPALATLFLVLVLLGSRQGKKAKVLVRLGAPRWVTHGDAERGRRVTPDVTYSPSRSRS